ncbi:MAG: M48 family metallopeptidase, partial [Clostridia bacterium]|nr:M48 family metallopeptidase [Clostridia bacterium]
MTDIRIIRSRRRTMAIQVKPDGAVTVRAPLGAPDKAVREFLDKHREWIEKTLFDLKKRRENAPPTPYFTDEEAKALKDAARERFKERLDLYAPLVGVEYRAFSVRMQKTRWGSCSRSGSISLNCLLLLTPPAVCDSVIVHELCHLKHMDHSKAFYGE